MSHLFEDYREINNVRDKLDLLIELVQSAPRRVFLTERGKVQAVVLSARDYEYLWRLELDRIIAEGDEEENNGEIIPHEEVMRGLAELSAKLKAGDQ